jgi:hypothetical protein
MLVCLFCILLFAFNFQNAYEIIGVVAQLSMLSFLAHLSQSDRVSFCDRFSSGVWPASVPWQPKEKTLNIFF